MFLSIFSYKSYSYGYCLRISRFHIKNNVAYAVCRITGELFSEKAISTNLLVTLFSPNSVHICKISYYDSYELHVSLPTCSNGVAQYGDRVFIHNHDSYFFLDYNTNQLICESEDSHIIGNVYIIAFSNIEWRYAMLESHMDNSYYVYQLLEAPLNICSSSKLVITNLDSGSSLMWVLVFFIFNRFR
jgi:hypothetical protein